MRSAQLGEESETAILLVSPRSSLLQPYRPRVSPHPHEEADEDNIAEEAPELDNSEVARGAKRSSRDTFSVDELLKRCGLDRKRALILIASVLFGILALPALLAVDTLSGHTKEGKSLGVSAAAQEPSVGDKVQAGDGKEIASGAWSLPSRATATVTHVGQNQDFMLRNPDGVESGLIPRWHFVYVIVPKHEEETAASCDDSGWGDVAKHCGACRVLARNMQKYGGTCQQYCAAQGKLCASQEEEVDDTCAVEWKGSCSVPGKQNGASTDDMICTCKAQMPEDQTSSAWRETSTYDVLPFGANGCSAGYEIMTAEECQTALTALGVEVPGPLSKAESNSASTPRFCSTRVKTRSEHPMSFNINDAGSGHTDWAPVCHRHRQEMSSYERLGKECNKPWDIMKVADQNNDATNTLMKCFQTCDSNAECSSFQFGAASSSVTARNCILHRTEFCDANADWEYYRVVRHETQQAKGIAQACPRPTSLVEHLPRSAFKSSSHFNDLDVAWASTLGGHGWACATWDERPWLEWDFGMNVTITQVLTLGRRWGQWIAEYSLEFSQDGKHWSNYPTAFAGNDAWDSLYENEVEPPITARKLRLHVDRLHGAGAGRVELLGCRHEAV